MVAFEVPATVPALVERRILATVRAAAGHKGPATVVEVAAEEEVVVGKVGGLFDTGVAGLEVGSYSVGLQVEVEVFYIRLLRSCKQE
jgi:hypothetical protein